MNNKVRLNRLEKLYYMLINHGTLFPKVKFCMNTWLESKKHYEEQSYISTSIKWGSCNSAACALGSACLYGPFRKAGLSINMNSTPIYRGYYYLEAGEMFFGLTEEETVYLFGLPPSGTKVTTRTIASRVKKLITKYSKSSNKKKAA